jgi:ATP adenylyltransferase
MVVPYRHGSDLGELGGAELLDCQFALQEAVAVMQECIRPQGFNIGLNIGKAAGAGIDQHLHWHVVPRWVGDTNFMPLIGGVKIVSESIEESYRRLLAGYAARREDPGA